jgi:tRNA-2-methylthio-N6-dimethylallyladenosine synthase
MAETETVCEQLHLPLQSGSDRMLARMHRGYNVARYMSKLELARRHIPDLTVSTDLIVGFPGETEADFQATLEVVRESQYDHAFTFIFSPRPGTAAAQMTAEFVPAEIATERLLRLADLQNQISLARNQVMVGRRFEVLVEGPSRKDPAVATTRSRGGKVVHVRGSFAPGTFFEAIVSAAAPHHLVGSVA